MGNDNNTQRVYFKNLDMLRFIAAYMIVLLHSFFGWKAEFNHPEFITSTFSKYWLDKLEIIMHNFAFGVDIFFMISGFLIVYLLLSEKEKTGKVDVLKFYIRRAFRIWPLYFLIVLIGPLLRYFLAEKAPSYTYHFLFAGNFDIIENGLKSAATNHLWSICIEEHFYLFCPLLIGFIPMKKLPQVLLSIIFICIIFRGFFAEKTADYGMAIYVHTLSRIDILALGGLFGYLYYYKKLQFNHALPIRLMVYATFILIFFNTDYNESGTFLTDTMKKYLYALPAAYWMGNFMFNLDVKFAIKNPAILNQFGKASYGIYMFNPIIIFVIASLLAKYALPNYFLFLLLVHVALALTTFLSYHLLELPFLALKEKYAVVKSGTTIKTNKETLTEASGITDTEAAIIPVLKNKAN